MLFAVVTGVISALADTVLGLGARVGIAWYLTGTLWFLTGASVAWMKLHPSVRVRLEADLRSLALGLLAVFAAGGFWVASRLDGMVVLAVGTLVCLAVGVPLVARLFPRVVRAQFQTWRDSCIDPTDDEDETVVESVTDQLERKREAWQLAAPLSVVDVNADDDEPTRRLNETNPLTERADLPKSE